MYIYSFSNHSEVVQEQLSNKKSLLKKRVNRADNFVNLSLLGLQEALEGFELQKESNLYMASDNGNFNSTIKVLENIIIQKKLPMPFTFLNSVNASILFFVAKSYGIEGKAIFVHTLEAALTQAYVDVKNEKTVLLGVVNETMANLELHKKRFKCDEVKEESQWLLLSKDILDKEPIAKVEALTLNSKIETSQHNLTTLFSFLESEEKQKQFYGKNLSFIVTKS